jgi:hypothetical protein
LEKKQTCFRALFFFGESLVAWPMIKREFHACVKRAIGEVEADDGGNEESVRGLSGTGLLELLKKGVGKVFHEGIAANVTATPGLRLFGVPQHIFPASEGFPSIEGLDDAVAIEAIDWDFCNPLFCDQMRVLLAETLQRIIGSERGYALPRCLYITAKGRSWARDVSARFPAPARGFFLYFFFFFFFFFQVSGLCLWSLAAYAKEAQSH